MAPRSSNTPPPTGTITFLFTDIEGSTALYENYPYRMRDARKRHDEILRSSMESQGGYVFKTVGDEFCAAFTTATEAIQAALAAQRALSSEEWPENIALKVRMGLHTGVAEESEGDYFGPPVNRVARLMSTGHGGQVLLSDATYNLVRDALPHLEPDAELRYLGEHRLKDLKHTERIFQLNVPDLPKEFASLKTHGLLTPTDGVNLDRNYHRIRYLGGGGFADVYLVHHETLDKDMALKVLKREYASDEQFVRRFKREARSAAKLSHPNVVQVHDAGEGIFEGNRVSYIATEYVRGGTLRDLIRQHDGPLPPRLATNLMLQIAKALEVAHRGKVVHRDIKPENILLTESGEAKVADFGLATALSASTRAVSGSALGTPRYMSPEQAQGERASFRSDLYSLGVVLYEMLTGKVPFDAETPVGVALKHISESLRSPKEANPQVPDGINVVCVRLLAKDPNERYPSAATLIEDLERVRDNPNAAIGDTGPTISSDHERTEDDLGALVRDGGPETVEVPDLSGHMLPQARSTLVQASLSMGRQEESPSETVPEGEIVTQDPPAGTEVEADSLVSVMISSGAQKKSAAAEVKPERQDQQTSVRHKRGLLSPSKGGRALLALVAVVLALALVTTPFYLWGASRYFLGFDEGEVVVYRGLPYAPLGYELNQEVRRTGVEESEIDAPQRDQVLEHLLYSESEVDAVVLDLVSSEPTQR